MSRGIRALVALVGIVALATAQLSCAGASRKTPPLADDPTAAAAPSDALPQEVVDELIPPIDFGLTEEQRASEPRFDVTVDRAPAREFFMSLVEGTSYSIALAPDIAGEISLSLRDVTVEEVLDTLQQAYGYGYEKTRTGFLVLPAGLRTQVFQLNYLNLNRAGSSETRVSSGQISDQIAGGAAINQGNATTTDGGASGGTVSGSRIRTRSETDLWIEVIDSVKAIVGDGPGRSVVTSPNAGLLVVRGLPGELAEVSRYLRRAEQSLNRVVILEAKILEVTLRDGFQSGINWAKMIDPNNTDMVIGQAGGGSVNETGFSDSRGASNDLGPPLEDLFAGTANSAFGGVFSLAIQGSKFSAFIELLETQGTVRTLSNPRISTVNNQKAVIKVGRDEFFVTDVSTTTVTGTATTSNPNVELTPFFSGIALDVTPQISAEEDVILHVHPAVTEVVDQTKSFTVSGDVQEIPTALSSIRESDSIVRARSGQIVVIGGLIQNDQRDQGSGLPWVRRLPWLGRLFEHEQITTGRTELVILLRPIVIATTTWDDELRATSHRMDENWGEIRSLRSDELRMDGWLPPTPPPASHQP